MSDNEENSIKKKNRKIMKHTNTSRKNIIVNI